MLNIQSLLESSISNIECLSPTASDCFSAREKAESTRPKTVVQTTKYPQNALALVLNEPNEDDYKENMPFNTRRSSVKHQKEKPKVYANIAIEDANTLGHQKYQDLISRGSAKSIRDNGKTVYQLSSLGALKASIQNDSRSKMYTSNMHPKSTADLHKNVDILPKKSIVKTKSKKGKKLKPKMKNMFLAPNKSSKNLLSNTIKTSSSGASLHRKSPNSVRTLEGVSKFKLSKNKIISLNESKKLGSKTRKDGSSKKTRNLYYEIKNAMTEKLSHKNNQFTAKRNSLNSAGSSSSKCNAFEYANFTNSSSRPSLGNICALPKSNRLADIKGM